MEYNKENKRFEEKLELDEWMKLHIKINIEYIHN